MTVRTKMAGVHVCIAMSVDKKNAVGAAVVISSLAHHLPSDVSVEFRILHNGLTRKQISWLMRPARMIVAEHFLTIQCSHCLHTIN